MARATAAPTKANLAFLQQAQRLYGFGGAAVPLQLRSNTARTMPIGYRFAVSADAAARATVAGLRAGTIVEDFYAGVDNGYLSSAGNNNGSWQGWILGVSADAEPMEAGAAAGPTSTEITDVLNGLNLYIESAGLVTEIPLRESLKLFPNLVTGNAAEFATGACPGSGTPTLAIPGGVPWQGDQASKLEIRTNRAIASALGWVPPVRFTFRLWVALALLGVNTDEDVNAGSIPGLPPCDDTENLANSFVMQVSRSRG